MLHSAQLLSLARSSYVVVVRSPGAYRALYILNWVYRSYYEPYYHHNWIVYTCGALQTALYADFFYYYVISKYYGGKLQLPT